MTYKIRTRMMWAPELRFPAFADDALTTAEVTYKLSACIVHVGEGVTNGHYRALLVQEDTGRKVLRYCDDGTKAKILSNFDGIAGDVYVLFFNRETPSLR